MVQELKEELHIRGGDGQGAPETQEAAKTQQQATQGGGAAWYGKPAQYGDAAGDKIQSTLGKVGQPVGTALEHAVAPVGGLVDSLLGATMRSKDAIGLGNDMMKDEDKKTADEEEMRKPMGGQKQTGENPLGL